MLRMRRFFRALSRRMSSSLSRRIVVLNLGGLVALLAGFLYLNQFREGLIDARSQSLLSQAEIIAAAVAASATVETNSITIDPEKLLQLQPGQSAGIGDDANSSLFFSINPERIGPVLRKLVSPTRTRARIYDRDGDVVLDSRSLSVRGSILRAELPPPESSSIVVRVWDSVKQHVSEAFGQNFAPRRELSTDDIASTNGRGVPEVDAALGGARRTMVRVNQRGETIISVGVPIQRFRAVRGALVLATQGGDIDTIIASERWAILRVFAVSAIVMVVLSLLLAGTIAEPMRRLAEAAERVRRGTKSRQEIPDFTDRADEIGHLSGALRDMTKALYNRIEAIESFAADVAHELKNPLTSLRSAVETLPRIKTESSRARLMDVIQHDVRRLDRLISDISDASRLDAELARSDMMPVDLAKLLNAVVSGTNSVDRPDQVQVLLTIEPRLLLAAGMFSGEDYLVSGFDSRLGQVINNLIDNARSFSPHGGEVRVMLRHLGSRIELVVDDDGPGIPSDAFERIFERFYTDRPEQGFGQNSGLGLSISRQIIEAHHGRIFAQNRLGKLKLVAATGTDELVEEPTILGARFVVQLPALNPT
eukprot:gene15485-15629_t